MISVALFIGVALAAIAIAILLLGLRGRRVDDAPLCRRCGYDLSARTSDICSECGADLSRPRAIRIGHRARSRGWLAISLVLLAITLPTITAITVVRVREIDLIRFRPASWLMKDVFAASSPADRVAAMMELLKRVRDDSLSPSNCDALSKIALAEQANLAKPWMMEWGQMLEAMHASHRLSDEDWKLYARQAIQIQLVARPIVRQGDPIPISFNTDHRLGDALFNAKLEWIDLHCGDVRPTTFLHHYGTAGLFNFSGRGGGSSYYTPSFDRTMTPQIPVGQQTVEAKYKLYLNEGASDDHLDWADQPASHEPEALTSMTMTQTSPIEIAAPDAPMVITTIDDQLRDAVRRCVVVDQASMKDDYLSAELTFKGPPVQLNFNCFARFADGRELQLDRVNAPKTPSNSSYGYVMRSRKKLSEVEAPATRPDAAATTSAATSQSPTTQPTEFDLLLRVDRDAVIERVEMTPAWGEDVIIEHVPISPPPPPTTAPADSSRE